MEIVADVQPKKTDQARRLILLNLAVVLLFLAIKIGATLTTFNIYPIDGAFQLFNPLRRLAAGQELGRDFQFFHGPGTLLLHYPLFHLFGGDLKASELGRWITSPVLFSIGILVFAFFLECSAVTSFGILSLFFFFLEGHRYLLIDLVWPGNSLLGVRSFLPLTLMMVCLMLRRNGERSPHLPSLETMLGLGLGMSLFVSTEQGLAGLAGYGAALFLVPPVADVSWRRRAVGLLQMVVLCAGTYLFLLRVFCGTGWTGILRYTWVDMPMDQFWYFGTPPASYVTGWQDLFIYEHFYPFWVLLILTLVLFFTPVRLHPCGRNGKTAILTLAFYTLASQVALLSSLANYGALAFRGCLLVLIYLFIGCWRNLSGFQPYIKQNLPRLSSPEKFAGLCFLLCLTCAFLLLYVEHRDNPSFPSECGRFAMSPAYQSEIEVSKRLTSNGERIISTYAGLVEASAHTFAPVCDYIIHDLGTQRGRFLDNVKQITPAVFVTLNPYQLYEPWVRLRHWDLYDFLLRWYDPGESTKNRLFWTRRSRERVHPATELSIQRPSENTWEIRQISPTAPVLYTGVIHYKVFPKSGWVPVLGKLPRYLLNLEARDEENRLKEQVVVPLPPHLTSWTFPLYLNPSLRYSVTSTISPNPFHCEIEMESLKLNPLTDDQSLLVRKRFNDLYYGNMLFVQPSSYR